MFIFSDLGPELSPGFPRIWLARGWGKIVTHRQYFARQAAILFRLAHSVQNRDVAAALIVKAADLKWQSDETGAATDRSLKAPDVEPEIKTNER